MPYVGSCKVRSLCAALLPRLEQYLVARLGCWAGFSPDHASHQQSTYQKAHAPSSRASAAPAPGGSTSQKGQSHLAGVSVRNCQLCHAQCKRCTGCWRTVWTAWAWAQTCRARTMSPRRAARLRRSSPAASRPRTWATSGVCLSFGVVSPDTCKNILHVSQKAAPPLAGSVAARTWATSGCDPCSAVGQWMF